MKTLLSIKTDPKVKKQAKKLADEFGLSLSALVTAQLKQAIRTKTVFLSAESYTPSPYLEKILTKADSDIKAGRNLSPGFHNAQDAIDWLKAIKNEH